MDSRPGKLVSTLDIARQFASQVGGVPVEIVEASAQTGVLGGDTQNVVSQEEPLEIMDVTGAADDLASSLTVSVATPSSGLTSGMSQVGPLAASTDQLTTTGGASGVVSGSSTTEHILSVSSIQAAQDNLSVNVSDTLTAGLGVDSSNLEQLQQTAMQTFQEVSRSLRSEGIEISPEAIAGNFQQQLADSLASMVTNSGSQSATSVLEAAISQSTQCLPMGINMSYSDLSDVNRVISSNVEPSLTATPSMSEASRTGMATSSMESVLNEAEMMPSSPESTFDTNDLLNTVSHRDEVMSKLASSGPVGVAAAAAIVSSRKRKRHSFESNPALRKRYCSKLMRKLKETLDELSTRVGLQTCVVTYRPSVKQDKPDPSFKVFGTSPLTSAIEKQKDHILLSMDEALKKQIPIVPLSQQPKHALFELPAMVFDGIPTPVQEMTQAQLRAFIPMMLKYSTGRGKPGWGKSEMRPVWWPEDVPWMNVRSDVRTDEQKKTLPWTDALRRIVTCCYVHHGRSDLLQQYHSRSIQEEVATPVHSVENVNQLQLSLHQPSEINLSALQAPETGHIDPIVGSSQGGAGVVVMGEGVSGTGGVGDVGVDHVEGSAEQGLVGSDNHQVFTIDTGMGNCDTTGMPTLADASLAETAARLQQVADETGQVQYATQTVTVTDRDAKALGQPVGSTTTVLLTAYPSGHGPASSNATTSPQQFFPTTSTSSTSTPPPPPPFTSSSSAANTMSAVSTGTSSVVPSVQVVYSAAHISDLPDSIMSGMTGSSSMAHDLYSSASLQDHGVVTEEIQAAPVAAIHHMDTSQTVTDYLTSPQVMATSEADIGAGLEDSGHVADLASQYINQFAAAAAAAVNTITMGEETSNTATSMRSTGSGVEHI